MLLTRKEAYVLRRLERGQTAGSSFLLQFCIKKGLAVRVGDDVVTTQAGRDALRAYEHTKEAA